MKVLLLGNSTNDGQESMQRFASFMANGLRDAGHEVHLLRPPSIVGRLRPGGNGIGKWLGYVDKFGFFPPILKAATEKADVVHICDQGNAHYTKYLQGIPHVLTCHDLLAVRSAIGEIPQNPTRWTGKKLQRLILNGLTRAQHVACVSDATRGDVLRLTGREEQTVSRVYNSLYHPRSPLEKSVAQKTVRELGIDPSQPFLVHVGGNQWYKNRIGALRIFSFLRKLPGREGLKLVMVGKPWTSKMHQLACEKGLNDAVLELTGVGDEQLTALYSMAKMMLFPSLQEGFGLPLIEAQACGCPVATSNLAPMTEIGGNAAIYFDPGNPESAAAVINEALERAASLRGPSMANAARFRSGMIESYGTLYEQVCREKADATIGASSGELAHVPSRSSYSATGAE